MNILVFNSSMRGKNGATEIVLNKFLEGVMSAGGKVEKIYLKDKYIRQCQGCFGCWVKTPGKCLFQDDDMPDILNKIEAADVIVYATPLYHFNMTSSMKIMLEKTLPCVEPFLEKDKHLTTHTKRENHKRKKWVIVSVCGLPEIDHFQSLDSNFAQLARVYGADIVGKIYRPASEALKAGMPVFGSYLKKCFVAGEELVKNGRITDKTQKKLYVDFVMPKFIYRFISNQFWKIQINKNKQ